MDMETLEKLRKPWNGGDVIISLTGADVRDWLQGQVTNDIRLLNAATPLHFCLCSPNGMIHGIGTLHELSGEIVAVLDQASAEVLLSRVQYFVILEEVGATVIDSGSSEFVSSSDLEFERLLAIEPRFGVDIGTKTIPNDLGEPFFSKYISLTKGCYTGQEIVHRVHSLGKPKKGWFVVEGESLEVGDEILSSEGLKVGSLSSVANQGEKYLAGAWILLDAAESGGPLLVQEKPIRLRAKSEQKI